MAQSKKQELIKHSLLVMAIITPFHFKLWLRQLLMTDHQVFVGSVPGHSPSRATEVPSAVPQDDYDCDDCDDDDADDGNLDYYFVGAQGHVIKLSLHDIIAMAEKQDAFLGDEVESSESNEQQVYRFKLPAADMESFRKEADLTETTSSMSLAD
jgi:hypothetical protein